MAYFSPLYSIKYLISCLWLISLHCIPSNILSVAYGLFLSTVFHQISYQLLMAYFSPLYSIKCGRPCEYLISCLWLISLHCIPSNILSVAHGLFLSTVFHQISYQLLMAYFSPLYSIKYLISCSWLISLHCIPSNILSVAYGLFLSTVFHQISYQLLMAYFSPLYSIKYLISCSWLISLHCIPSSVVDHGQIKPK